MDVDLIFQEDSRIIIIYSKMMTDKFGIVVLIITRSPSTVVTV